jgi:hypothetical protein
LNKKNPYRRPDLSAAWWAGRRAFMRMEARGYDPRAYKQGFNSIEAERERELADQDHRRWKAGRVVLQRQIDPLIERGMSAGEVAAKVDVASSLVEDMLRHPWARMTDAEIEEQGLTEFIKEAAA